MKIGIFGGTFNPPHMGHLIVAESVRSQLGLQRVVFVPSFISPHKQDRAAVTGNDRLAMLRLALGGDTRYAVSDRELQRGGVSYTVDTLAAMKKDSPGDDLFLLIGMDNLLDFHTWKDPLGIAQLATVVVMTRPGFSLPERLPVEGIELRHCVVPAIAISSSVIRENVRTAKSIRYLVPEPVESYILSRGLYHGQVQNDPLEEAV
jgi:nicotinate-nucleotide adenylyltransferase